LDLALLNEDRGPAGWSAGHHRRQKGISLTMQESLPAKFLSLPPNKISDSVLRSWIFCGVKLLIGTQVNLFSGCCQQTFGEFSLNSSAKIPVINDAPPPGRHLRLFWRGKKHQVLFSDETSHA
jgi:hypothetical protein